MKTKSSSYDRLVKSEDLNHHGTLFAGRCAEWFVEAAFIASASILPAENIVCLKIHGLKFSSPIVLGQIAHFESKLIHTGRTSFKVYVQLSSQENKEPIVSGFITFVHVNDLGKPIPHGITLELTEEEDIQLNSYAKKLY
jgi:acyl-CoA hydrolase